MYVFNLSGKFSPWYNEYKYPIIRKNSLKLSTELHKEIGWIGSNIFKIDSKKTKGRFKHFTHNNPDDFLINILDMLNTRLMNINISIKIKH